MSRSVYVIGGAGAGKSAFTAALMEDLTAGPCEVFHRRRKTDGVMDPISGHRLSPGDGLYIGKLRPSFPGTDGLSRSCTPVGVEWLEQGDLPSYIVAEGATLATQGFLAALQAYTDLLVVHLRADPDEVRRRMSERGSSQKESWVAGTVTRARNVAQKFGAMSVDTGEQLAWDMAIDLCKTFLQNH